MEDKYQDLRIILAQPEVMPCHFDNTIEFWIKRISLWGELKIKHTDTNSNPVWLTPDQMLEFLTDSETINSYGQWNAEKLSYKSLVLKRDFTDAEGNRHEERMWVDIDLKPEIKKGMKFSE